MRTAILRIATAGLALLWPALVRAQTIPLLFAQSEDKGYSRQYTLVILCIALGLLVVCRPSRRAEEDKPHYNI